ncbi:hypothetical protein [Qipengyuania sphaerica]|uniref:hypothetical protein n=1 Tax=Qipengyuania sphaerica TaxID=2867243 RepID=UPI001C887BE3|nr:hypothetical protein [Qipengyuania sphaerica]MBX7541727.1 hypothetical protein [Qipengyuania sphaerica]
MVVFPLVGGLLVFWFHEAPRHYALVNLTAFALGLLAIAFARIPKKANTLTGIGIVLVCLLALPILTGPSLDGVTRWLPLGPLKLHSGMLVIPMLAAIAIRLGKRGWWILAAAMIASVAQPDAASVLALSLASFALVHLSKDWRPLAVGAAGLPLTYLASTRGDLPAVEFVEAIVPMLWVEMDLKAQAIGLAALLLAPILYLTKYNKARLDTALAVAASYCGFLAMSFIGDYPVPLAGYGAASILGLMLGIAMIAPAQSQSNSR